MNGKLVACIEDCKKCSLVSCNFNPEFFDIYNEIKNGGLAKAAAKIGLPSREKYYSEPDTLNMEQILGS